MTAITTGGNGAWNSTTNNAPWVGGVVPVTGDTVIIANGHTVNIPVGYTAACGVDALPHTVPALQTRIAGSGTGVIQIDSGGNLTLFGDVICGGAPWTMGAGCTLTAACTTASLPFGISDGSALAKFTVNGVAGNRSIITKAGGAVGWKIFGNDASNFSGGGQLCCTYTTIDSVGSAAVPMHRARPIAGFTAFFSHCLISGCGSVEFSHNAADGITYYWEYTTVRTPTNTSSYVAQLLWAAWTTGTRSFTSCRWEGILQMSGAAKGTVTGITMSDIMCRNYTATDGTGPIDFGTSLACTGQMTDVWVFQTTTNGGNINAPSAGTFLRTVFTHNYNNNHHDASQVVSDTTTWDGTIIYSDVADEQGSSIIPTQGPASAKTVTVQNSIVLPCGADATKSSATLLISVSGTNSANLRFVVKNNTCHLGQTNRPGAVASELYAFAAGDVTGPSDSIYWRAALAGAPKAQYNTAGADLPTDGAYVGTDYNWCWNVGAAFPRSAADAKFSTPSPPGAHDTIGQDPQFYDRTRNPIKWGTSVSATITNMSTLSDALMKSNDDSGAIAGLTLALGHAWIKTGFTPQNVATKTAGSSGGQVGAVGWATFGDFRVDRRRRTSSFL